ncbi:PBP1A family penicillin-binding protein [Clostridium tyrobutyricum]|jgi:penicillin-binding protein 1A|uniref:Penicillin-binding protein 1A n=1 Tax=Clostridium tyrobutyricum DIVETGP TaxID=1408889 RepID=W6N5Z4_CLOTY|nr:PBP1A family penicillin-binding protein [Clostridium tyrobutyricum]AND84148.1 penicillin-binding protein 1A [Clostridium tyrobutyricum]ANP68874.1 peptidase [Clostridium tyrobutyricum]MBV4415873.1 PBP1A family penicillin-binding protein [Clostridium tyrobutyricum]MBV4421862.1 PBP1A family penicillin-binding protein [Clostridium tyrobutyricum]MBV4425391.1 PBP1A family penicillin-binding protein [Clostridium tyrobutyricum]
MGKSQKKSRKKTPKKTQKKTLKLSFTILICIFLSVVVICIGVGAAIIKSAPALDVNRVLNLNEPSVLYDDKGNMADTVTSTEQRTVLSFNNIPDNLKHAFISIEDERFYKHKGIDIKRIAGVVLIDIGNKIKRQSGLQGASTITQQLVRGIYLSPQVTITRKLQEIYLSIKLEKLLTKDQILEGYMNTIFLGGRAFGVESASQQYFGKSASSLNLIECAFIAGIPQSPSVYYPYSSASKKNPSIYLNRTKSVLKKMYENNYISEQQYVEAINNINKGNLHIKPYSPQDNRLEHEWFSMPAMQQVKNDLKTKYNYSDSQVNQMITYGGLKIYTTMDKSLQKQTESILNNSTILQNNSAKDKNEIIQPQASAVVIDYHTGEVKALVGGRGTQPAMSYNRAASQSYLRPPGSGIKPLTVYSPAIESKKYTAATVLEDSPWSDDIARKYGTNGSAYTPTNEGTFSYTNMTLRTAIMKSSNAIAAKVEDKIGLETGASYAEKFGLNLDATDKSSMAALSLGEMYHGTDTLQMAAAYGVFGNNGIYTSPRLYTKVTDRSGKVILESKVSTRKVLSANAAYVMYDLLKSPVSSEGTGSTANFSDMARGKTGTSSDDKNLWFSGLTPYYSASVWIGNDDNSRISGLNSNSSAAIWASIMTAFHEGLPYKEITMPSGVVTEQVSSETGKLPSPLYFLNPSKSKYYTEVFIDGTEPTEQDTISDSLFDNNNKNNDNNKNSYKTNNQQNTKSKRKHVNTPNSNDNTADLNNQNSNNKNANSTNNNNNNVDNTDNTNNTNTNNTDTTNDTNSKNQPNLSN